VVYNVTMSKTLRISYVSGGVADFHDVDRFYVNSELTLVICRPYGDIEIAKWEWDSFAYNPEI
jgi:hypothetical protein